MSEFKGTKGKWILKENEFGYYNSVRNESDSKTLFVSRVNNQTENNANFLLISKAPEMLEMLQRVSDKLNGNGFPSLQFQIDELIKEATTL